MSADSSDPAPNIAGPNPGPGHFSYKVENCMKEPYFEESVDLPIIAINHPLVRYMEEVVLAYPSRFKSFEMEYTSPYGYFIKAINGQRESYKVDGTYWKILNQSGALSVGASWYVPQPDDKIVIKLTNSPPSCAD